uniref:Uncharacterized protein n=1 Tax=Roseihalotalea indica TaxID=2867963 RepID=A0AA49GNR4_9BACT|nr:hypothetical protein K4G66_05940 [Tunicatimonas sp. TK19036]
MKKLVVLTGFSFLFAMIGFYLWGWFFKISIHQVNVPNLEIDAFSGQFLTHLTFIITLGLIPLIYTITIRLGQIEVPWKKLVALGVILAAGICFWQLRIQFLQMELLQIPIDSYLILGSLNFQFYLLTGLIFGAFLSGVTFKLIQENV